MIPTILFHGTVKCYSESIEQHGLLKLKNEHVYLTEDIEHAYKEALKHGVPIIICIVDSEAMQKDGFVFKQNNDEWTTDHVPSKYILQVQIEKYQELKELKQSVMNLLGKENL